MLTANDCKKLTDILGEDGWKLKDTEKIYAAKADELELGRSYNLVNDYIPGKFDKISIIHNLDQSDSRWQYFGISNWPKTRFLQLNGIHFDKEYAILYTDKDNKFVDTLYVKYDQLIDTFEKFFKSKTVPRIVIGQIGLN